MMLSLYAPASRQAGLRKRILANYILSLYKNLRIKLLHPLILKQKIAFERCFLVSKACRKI